MLALWEKLQSFWELELSEKNIGCKVSVGWLCILKAVSSTDVLLLNKSSSDNSLEAVLDIKSVCHDYQADIETSGGK